MADHATLAPLVARKVTLPVQNRTPSTLYDALLPRVVPPEIRLREHKAEAVR